MTDEETESDRARRALAHRRLADLEARRRTRGGSGRSLDEFLTVGFSRRQAEALRRRNPLFIRAFLTECDRVFGATACPHRMPDWLRLELTLLYRSGGFTDPQVAALVEGNADVWRCAARNLGLRDTSPLCTDLTPPGDDERERAEQHRDAEEGTAARPMGEPDPALKPALRRFRRHVVLPLRSSSGSASGSGLSSARR